MSIRKPKNLESKAADLIRDLYKNYKYYKRRFGTKDPVFYMVASKIIEEVGLEKGKEAVKLATHQLVS